MKIKKSILVEDTVADLAKDEDTEVVSSDKPNEITEALDEALEASLEAQAVGDDEWQNVLIVGEAGIGKTAIVKQWCRKNGINLVDMKVSTMDETDLSGVLAPGQDGAAVRLASTELDELDTIPNSVLFLDELNRGRKNVLGTLLTLIQDHTIPDVRVKGRARKLKNFLFTIACINPNDSRYDTIELDDAMRGRFRELEFTGNKDSWLDWMLKTLDGRAAIFKDNPDKVRKIQNQKALITMLVKDKDFKFDDVKDIERTHEEGNGRVLSPRNLTKLLLGSKGTKEDFLKKWNQYVNSLDYNMAKRALEQFKEVEGKGNEVLKKYKNAKFMKDTSKDDDEPVLKNSKSNYQKVMDILDTL